VSLQEIEPKYKQLKDAICGRKGVPELFDYVEKLGYKTAPASRNYHGSFNGGLLCHSVMVTEILLRLRKVLLKDMKQVSGESCILVGLFHDIGKLGTEGRPYYVPKWNQGYTINENNNRPVYLDHAIRSVVTVSHFVKLKTWEAQAIAGHDGQYISANKDMSGKETPLTLMLHFADCWSAFHVEAVYAIPNEEWLNREVKNEPERG
jgi:hypothetical protein